MSTAEFKRAKLIPFDAGGKKLEESRAIPLDFNPETLTLKVSGGEQKDKGRKGRQQVQNVGASKATLNFECVFDSTRPRDGQGGDGGGGEELLDVRTRTKPIADLLQVFGSGKEQAPRRVQFAWGTLIFNGVISSHQEVFDYFSPSGVPLRSKVQLTLTEQEFRYDVAATDAAQRRQAVEQANAGARAQAAAAGAGSVLGAGGPFGAGLGLDLSAGFALEVGIDLDLDLGLSADLGFSAKFGASADFGLSVGAGVHLDAAAAVDLFGAAALGGGAGGTGGGVDLGRSGLALPQPSPGLAAAGAVPNPWAPEGPAPGSRAAGLAAVVANQRAGGALARPAPATAGGAPPGDPGAAPPPLPVRGSPPLAPQRSLGTAVPLLSVGATPVSRDLGERRPRWESLPPAAATAAFHQPGCGCRRCGADAAGQSSTLSGGGDR